MDDDLRRNLYRTGMALAALIAVLGLVLGAWQVALAPWLQSHPSNPRLALAAASVVRGTVYDRRLRVLARSEFEGGRQVRRYPHGEVLAHVLGYRTARSGKAGLEAQQDAYLLGLPPQGFWQEVRNRLRGRPAEGHDLVLTLDLDVQRAAAEALGGRRGAVVAIDPRTGAVLASASRPSFDPHQIETQVNALRGDPRAPLLNRVAQGLYPPGSTFTVVTAAAALSRLGAQAQGPWPCRGPVDVDGTAIGDTRGRVQGPVTTIQALAYSCGAAFAQMGLRVGGAAVVEMAQALGLGRPVTWDLPAAEGRLPRPPNDRAALARLALGQGDVLASPLQMALLASALANRGLVVAPYLLAEVRTHEGRVLLQGEPRRGKRVLDDATARALVGAMVDAVHMGAGRPAAIHGTPVAGLAGVAAAAPGSPVAWFIGYAPAERPAVAVAVVMEQSGREEDAAGAARRVLTAALAAQREPERRRN